MTPQLIKDKVAKAWQKPGTEKIEFIPELAEAFGEILNEIWSQPWLGNATCEELLEELTIRIEVHGPGLDYKTTGKETKSPDISEPVEENPIPQARKVFRDAFDKDSDFKQGYIANIAMLLHDHHGITDFDKRNAAAEDILKLVFYS